MTQEAYSPSYSDFVIIEKINRCPKIPSLRRINDTLNSLLQSDSSFMAQIAEVIGRDPSLTSRLLNLVNSVFFNLYDSQPIKSIEEAAFYVGLKQIEELVTTTPIIEQFEALTKELPEVPWKNFWKHSLGTAILTREILSIANIHWEDDCDYLAGLLHNVGNIVIALAFTKEFKELNQITLQGMSTSHNEEALLKWDHARIGAYYLWQYHLPAEVVEATQFHHSPEQAQTYPELAAAVQIADLLTNIAGVHSLDNQTTPSLNDCKNLSGWHILFGEKDEEETSYVIDLLSISKDRIVTTINDMM